MNWIQYIWQAEFWIMDWTTVRPWDTRPQAAQKSIGRGGRCAWSPLLKLVGTLRKCSRNDERLREKSLSNLRLQSVCWKLIKADLFRFIAWILFSKVLFFSNKRTRLQLQIMSFFIRIKIHWLILRYKSSKSKFPFTVSSQLSLQTFL